MPKTFFNYQMALSTTISLGIGLSILSAVLVNKWESSNRQLRFQRQIENLATALQRSLTRHTDVLVLLNDYYQVTESQVARQAFADFVKRSLQTYSGIQALEDRVSIGEYFESFVSKTLFSISSVIKFQ